MFVGNALRLLREDWSDPQSLAEELYSMFTSGEPAEVRSPVTIAAEPGRTALRIAPLPRDGRDGAAGRQGPSARARPRSAADATGSVADPGRPPDAEARRAVELPGPTSPFRLPGDDGPPDRPRDIAREAVQLAVRRGDAIESAGLPRPSHAELYRVVLGELSRAERAEVQFRQRMPEPPSSRPGPAKPIVGLAGWGHADDIDPRRPYDSPAVDVESTVAFRGPRPVQFDTPPMVWSEDFKEFRPIVPPRDLQHIPREIPRATAVLMGKVTGGSGETWGVTLYPDGPDGDPGDDVEVTCKGVHADEEAPADAWIAGIARFGDTYFYQPTVWLE